MTSSIFNQNELKTLAPPKSPSLKYPFFVFHVIQYWRGRELPPIFVKCSTLCRGYQWSKKGHTLQHSEISLHGNNTDFIKDSPLQNNKPTPLLQDGKLFGGGDARFWIALFVFRWSHIEGAVGTHICCHVDRVKREWTLLSHSCWPTRGFGYENVCKNKVTQHNCKFILKQLYFGQKSFFASGTSAEFLETSTQFHPDAQCERQRETIMASRKILQTISVSLHLLV